jgi:hypothetical protein
MIRARDTRQPESIAPVLLDPVVSCGRESVCELRPGIGLCDECALPKWPQRYMGYGFMVCLDCINWRNGTQQAANNRI